MDCYVLEVSGAVSLEIAFVLTLRRLSLCAPLMIVINTNFYKREKRRKERTKKKKAQKENKQILKLNK